MGETIIISPHPDDECIGLYEVLVNPETNPIIIYTENVENSRREEALKLKEQINVKGQLFLRTIPEHFLNPENILYIPDPIFETHPAHRLQGAIGEQLVRGGLNVIFYNTNMQAPYCHEVLEPDKKEDLLNKVYPSQRNLWKWDKKYTLFEGRYKWIL